MKRGTTDMTKFKRLVRRFGGDRTRTVGILELLWQATEADAEDGAIGRLSDEDIAEAVGWPVDDAQALIAALVDEHWLDEHPDHRLIVHGWYEHCSDYIHQKLGRRGRLFADGRIPRDKTGKKKAALEAGAGVPGDSETELSASVATAPQLPSLAQANPAQSSPAQPPGGDRRRVDRGAAAPQMPLIDTGPARAAPSDEIFGQIESDVRACVGRKLRENERKRVPTIVNAAAVAGVPPYWLARWLKHFSEKKQRRGEPFGVALVEHAAREELVPWCHAAEGWSVRPPHIETLIPCPHCRAPSVGFRDGAIVPCVCPRQRPRPALVRAGAWLAAEVAAG